MAVPRASTIDPDRTEPKMPRVVPVKIKAIERIRSRFMETELIMEIHHCRAAAISTTLVKSMARVIGPTPPGIGAI
jgi:hypothetical protein